MAHYSGVNENALTKAILSCRKALVMENATSLVAEAKALPIDGAGAKDNITNTASTILSKTQALKGKLDAAYGVACEITEYKQVKKELDQVKKTKNMYYKVYQAQADKTTPAAKRYKSKYYKAKTKYNDLDSQLKALKASLSSKGYPPT